MDYDSQASSAGLSSASNTATTSSPHTAKVMKRKKQRSAAPIVESDETTAAVMQVDETATAVTNSKKRRNASAAPKKVTVTMLKQQAVTLLERVYHFNEPAIWNIAILFLYPEARLGDLVTVHQVATYFYLHESCLDDSYHPRVAQRTRERKEDEINAKQDGETMPIHQSYFRIWGVSPPSLGASTGHANNRPYDHALEGPLIGPYGSTKLNHILAQRNMLQYVDFDVTDDDDVVKNDDDIFESAIIRRRCKSDDGDEIVESRHVFGAILTLRSMADLMAYQQALLEVAEQLHHQRGNNEQGSIPRPSPRMHNTLARHIRAPVLAAIGALQTNPGDERLIRSLLVPSLEQGFLKWSDPMENLYKRRMAVLRSPSTSPSANAALVQYFNDHPLPFNPFVPYFKDPSASNTNADDKDAAAKAHLYAAIAADAAGFSRLPDYDTCPELTDESAMAYFKPVHAHPSLRALYTAAQGRSRSHADPHELLNTMIGIWEDNFDFSEEETTSLPKPPGRSLTDNHPAHAYAGLNPSSSSCGVVSANWSVHIDEDVAMIAKIVAEHPIAKSSHRLSSDAKSNKKHVIAASSSSDDTCSEDESSSEDDHPSSSSDESDDDSSISRHHRTNASRRSVHHSKASTIVVTNNPSSKKMSSKTDSVALSAESIAKSKNAAIQQRRRKQLVEAAAVLRHAKMESKIERGYDDELHRKQHKKRKAPVSKYDIDESDSETSSSDESDGELNPIFKQRLLRASSSIAAPPVTQIPIIVDEETTSRDEPIITAVVNVVNNATVLDVSSPPTIRHVETRSQWDRRVSEAIGLVPPSVEVVPSSSTKADDMVSASDDAVDNIMDVDNGEEVVVNSDDALHSLMGYMFHVPANFTPVSPQLEFNEPSSLPETMHSPRWIPMQETTNTETVIVMQVTEEEQEATMVIEAPPLIEEPPQQDNAVTTLVIPQPPSQDDTTAAVVASAQNTVIDDTMTSTTDPAIPTPPWSTLVSECGVPHDHLIQLVREELSSLIQRPTTSSPMTSRDARNVADTCRVTGGASWNELLYCAELDDARIQSIAAKTMHELSLIRMNVPYAGLGHTPLFAHE